MILKNLEKYIVNPYFAAIALTNDVIEFGIKVWTQNVPVFEILKHLDWLDISIKLFLAILVSRLFKLHKETKDNLDKIKQDYDKQKERLDNQLFLASLLNVLKISDTVMARIAFPNSPHGEAHKLEILKKALENEKNLLKLNLINMKKDKTIDEIDSMIADYYQVNF